MSLTSHSAINHPFIRKTLRTITDHGMLPKGASVLAGVSGGPDSMALLHTLMAVSDILSIRVAVAHLNHCLRPGDAEKDVRFVMDAAQKYGVPCHVGAIDIRKESKISGLSLEEAAREARYRFFNEICHEQRFDKIAVGHHGDDNAELILLYLIRGSGPAGMGGILPVRDNIIRPLIQASRAEILEFLSSQHITWRQDESNFDAHFLRNRIRHQLLPLLAKNYNPKISESLNRTGNILQAEEQWINALIDPIFEQTVADREMNRETNRKTGRIVLSAARLMDLPVAPRRRVVRRAILEVKGNLRRISFSHVDAVTDLANPDRADGCLDLPDRIRVSRQADRLVISQETTPLRQTPVGPTRFSDLTYSYAISEAQIINDRKLYVNEIDVEIMFTRTFAKDFHGLPKTKGNLAFFDWDRLQFPLTVRNYKTGDRFTPCGMAGTQSVKKFFINNKISPRIRVLTPILVSGETIIWIGGFRIAEMAKVRPDTRTLLVAELSQKNESNTI
jgi:tRNA(Ile)-lysidine synthase